MQTDRKVVISGSSGLVGSVLAQSLHKAGFRVQRLIRSETALKEDDIYWDPDREKIDAEKLNGVEVVVHLAGENIAARRWSKKQKARIRNSRVHGTWLLAKTLSVLKVKPKLFVSASAVGYYGNRKHAVSEWSPPGQGYLSDVCREWEAALDPAVRAGIRVVALRLGMVLNAKGGALAKMLPIFKIGMGGAAGSGMQPVSWISLEDVIAIVEFLISNDFISGPVNAIAPEVVSNMQFSKTLGKTLHRPVFFHVPAVLLRVLFGEMADSLILGGAPVVPKKLEGAGFKFKYPKLESALKYILNA